LTGCHLIEQTAGKDGDPGVKGGQTKTQCTAKSETKRADRNVLDRSQYDPRDFGHENSFLKKHKCRSGWSELETEWRGELEEATPGSPMSDYTSGAVQSVRDNKWSQVAAASQ
jgi:hypothetical protein